MFARTIVFALALVLPLVSASAAAQYKLNVEKSISTCWTNCHAAVIAAVHNTDSDPLGNTEAIGGNCADAPYINGMPMCLLTVCKSAPDIAYAMEFGQRWCKKAGIDVSKTLVLPEEYVKGTAKEYYESEAYLSSASLSSRPSTIIVGSALLLGSMAAMII